MAKSVSKEYLEELFDQYTAFVANQPEDELPSYTHLMQMAIKAIQNYDEYSKFDIRTIELCMQFAMCTNEEEVIACMNEKTEGNERKDNEH